MMKSIDERVAYYVSNGFTIVQARYKVAQEIILSKIEQSNYIDKILLKGGIVMYNITKEQRRTTSDLDLDFIRLDISKESNMYKFVEALNRYDTFYTLSLKKIKPLHQDDYKGNKLYLTINDNAHSRALDITVDIGVHTLLGIEQDKMCFTYDNENSLTLWVNPPEQIIAEKLFSLAKIGPDSTRYKDINDIYYLIKNIKLDHEVFKKCLSLLLIGNRYGFHDIYDLFDNVETCLESDLFSSGFADNNSKWLDVDYQTLKDTILNYISKI